MKKINKSEIKKSAKSSVKEESNEQYLIYDWQPRWLKPISFHDFKKIEDIIYFFMLITSNDKGNYQARKLKYFDWNDGDLWKENSYIANELKQIFENDDTYFKCFHKYKTFNEYLSKIGIEEKDIDKERKEVCFLVSNSKFKGFFQHIRNSFAHGRFALSGEYLIMEDVEGKKYARYEIKKVSINALVVIKIENIRKLINTIAAKNKIDLKKDDNE